MARGVRACRSNHLAVDSTHGLPAQEDGNGRRPICGASSSHAFNFTASAKRAGTPKGTNCAGPKAASCRQSALCIPRPHGQGHAALAEAHLAVAATLQSCHAECAAQACSNTRRFCHINITNWQRSCQTEGDPVVAAFPSAQVVACGRLLHRSADGGAGGLSALPHTDP